MKGSFGIEMRSLNFGDADVLILILIEKHRQEHYFKNP